MGDYINTEEMRRAACTFDNAVDNLNRGIGNFTEYVHMLIPLLGQGYGNNLEQLIQELRQFNDKNSPNSLKVARIEKYSVNVDSTNFKRDLCRIVDANNSSIVIGLNEEFESELAAYRFANQQGYLIKQ